MILEITLENHLKLSEKEYKEYKLCRDWHWQFIGDDAGGYVAHYDIRNIEIYHVYLVKNNLGKQSEEIIPLGGKLRQGLTYAYIASEDPDYLGDNKWKVKTKDN